MGGWAPPAPGAGAVDCIYNTQHQTANLSPLTLPFTFPLPAPPPSLKYCTPPNPHPPTQQNKLQMATATTASAASRDAAMTKMKDTTTASDATSDVFELCGALERLPSDVLLPDTLCGDAVLGSPCGVAADAGLCSPGVCATPAFAKEKGGDDWIDTYLRSNDCAAGTCCHYWCSQKRREANKENSAGASNSACSGEESTECKSKGAGSKSRMESLLSELSQPKPETNCQVVAAGSAEAKARKSKGSGRKARSLRGVASRSVRHGIRRTTASVQTGRRRRGG